ncbi:glycosyltransferase [Aeromonas hydrophila]|uniref:glycosyltransferase n=1 Tax=Aeromonas hydrophila TaxID=644 RepID=UPI0038D00E92
MPVLINHVMSVNTPSNIFDDFIERIKTRSPHNFQHIVSVDPLPHADIYHSHRPQRFLIDENTKKSICTIHFDPFDLRQHSSIHDLLIKLPLFQKVVFLNKNTFNACAFLDEKRHLIPHGYDPRLPLRSIKKPHNKVNIAFVCKYYKDGRKGEAYLFELFSLLPDNVQLILVGNNWPRTIEKRCKNIKIINPNNYSDIISIYSVIDIVIVTSPYEGGPACLPEAMAAGCAVFSSRCGMATDLLEEDFLLDYEIESDYRKILKSINYPSDPKIQDNFPKLITWDDVSNSYNNLYQSMV